MLRAITSALSPRGSASRSPEAPSSARQAPDQVQQTSCKAASHACLQPCSNQFTNSVQSSQTHSFTTAAQGLMAAGQSRGGLPARRTCTAVLRMRLHRLPRTKSWRSHLATCPWALPRLCRCHPGSNCVSGPRQVCSDMTCQMAAFPACMRLVPLRHGCYALGLQNLLPTKSLPHFSSQGLLRRRQMTTRALRGCHRRLKALSPPHRQSRRRWVILQTSSMCCNCLPRAAE